MDVSLSVSFFSVSHFPLYGHLSVAASEMDREGVSTDPLWFAFRVPSVLQSVEALFLMNLL